MVYFKKYDKPIEVPLKDFVYNKYVCSFEYGTFDNYVQAVVKEMDIPCKYVRKYTENAGIFKKGDFSICIKTTFTLLADELNEDIKQKKERTCYSTNLIKVKNLEDIENYKIEVIGEIIRAK